MSVYHPDIESFIKVKQNQTEINNFNISVIVDDAFMKAVINNTDIELKSPLGYVTKTISAKYLYDEICKSNLKHAEPGILFLDNINRDNPLLKTMGEMNSVNACFTGDMELLTEDGYKTFKDLAGGNVNLVNDLGKVTQGSVSVTGIKEVIKLRFSNGNIIRCTPDHRFKLTDGTECEASSLKGKKVLPFPQTPIIDDEYSKYGFVQGDGVTSHLLSKQHCGLEINIGEKDKDILNLFENEDYTTHTDGRKIYCKSIVEKLFLIGISTNTLPTRTMPIQYKNFTRIQKASFLNGCFSANGNVTKNHRISYKSSCFEFINELKKTLSEDFSIHSIITTNRKKVVKWDNGEYVTKQSYDLNINKFDDILLFASEIGFQHKYKNGGLRELIAFKTPHVTSIISCGEELVYDFTEPETHWGIVNGVVAHNCGEIPMYPNEACCLASIILPTFITDGIMDIRKLKEAAYTTTRFLDNSIDINNYPDTKIAEAHRHTRRLGIGIMGLHSALQMLGLSYDSEEGRTWAKGIMKIITESSQEYSEYLIEEGRELPPAWYGSTFEEKGIKVRNIAFTSGQPTGATQIIASEICGSSGIESIFSVAYKRKIKDVENPYIMVDPTFKDMAIKGQFYSEELIEKILNNNGSVQDLIEVPVEIQKLFKTALEIDWNDHLLMQSAIQEHTSNALSKTINMSSNTILEDVQSLYMKAWELGCKGCTIYVQGSRDSQPINIETKKEITGLEENRKSEYVSITPTMDIASCVRFKIPTGCGSMWLILAYSKDGKLKEVFSQTASTGGCRGQTEAVSRLISAGLKANIDPLYLVEQLHSVKCDVSSKISMKNKNIGRSCADGMGRVIKDFVNGKYNEYIGIPSNIPNEIPIKAPSPIVKLSLDSNMKTCPDCGENTLFKYDGCVSCQNCSYTKCG